MLKPELYKKTVEILFQAYFNDTLERYDCHACAVGNIVMANMGLKLVNDTGFYAWQDAEGKEVDHYWANVHTIGGSIQILHPENYYGQAKEQIDATGYTWEQTARIEWAFEQAKGCDDERMFNGLQNVLEVLREIHQVGEPTHDAAVQPFATHYATKQLA